MKDKTKSGSKIPTTGKNTNQKKRVKSEAGLDLGSSLLKMNEFTLIIIGALVVTVLVFFLFFRSPDPGTDEDTGSQTETLTDTGLERRIAALEVSLARIASSPTAADTAAPDAKGQAALDQRITRLETALTLKLDSLLDRMARMENQMDKRAAAMKTASSSPAPKAKKPAAKTAAAAPSKPVPEKAPATKKPAQPKKKVQQFHTVKKGETLWSISQKYNTTVAAIRKLNKLSAEDKIYVGNNILVR